MLPVAAVRRRSAPRGRASRARASSPAGSPPTTGASRPSPPGRGSRSSSAPSASGSSCSGAPAARSTRARSRRAAPASRRGPSRARPASGSATSSPAVSAKPSVPRSCRSVVIATCQPPPISPRTFSSGTSTPVKKISLNSASPVIWRSGRTSTPGRVHVDDQVREPGVALALRVAARDEDAVVGDVRERRPHLLAVDDEVAVLAARGRAHGREVGARVGLGEALAPDLLGREDLLQVRCFCASVPWAMIVGPAMPSPITPRCGGASARAISSRKIAWWLYGRAGAAVLLRPGQARVAGLVQLPAPVAARLLEAAAPDLVASGSSSIHARSSARNAASSGVSRRSIVRL